MAIEMTTDIQLPALADLEMMPYLDQEGLLPSEFSKVVGIYAIFDQQQTLQFVGYSRDVTMSLTQHLVRCPELCYWFKIKTIDRPSRAVLETIQSAWIKENGDCPSGNGPAQERWTQPIDAKAQMTADEKLTLSQATSEISQSKALKTIARRVEADLKAVLDARGVKESLRFDPKLKEQGLLNIKPAK